MHKMVEAVDDQHRLRFFHIKDLVEVMITTVCVTRSLLHLEYQFRLYRLRPRRQDQEWSKAWTTLMARQSSGTRYVDEGSYKLIAHTICQPRYQLNTNKLNKGGHDCNHLF